MSSYKSQGESIIANILTKYNIPFLYEHPILIKEQKENDGEKLRIWYPDFWLPEYSIIIEFFGRDDPEYMKGKENKMNAYKNLKLDCIPVYPSTIKADLKSYLLIKIKTIINSKVRTFENRNKNISSD